MRGLTLHGVVVLAPRLPWSCCQAPKGFFQSGAAKPGASPTSLQELVIKSCVRPFVFLARRCAEQPNRLLFGTDLVSPKSIEAMTTVFHAAVPLSKVLSPLASYEVRMGNCDCSTGHEAT